MKKIVLVTGGFDPLHSGHIAYFKAARKLGNKLLVGVNSDEWLIRKKDKPFMNLEERINILNNLTMVTKAFSFDDNDNTANEAIHLTIKDSSKEDAIIFANGGDRDERNIPEIDAFNDYQNVNFVFGVGGKDKKNSSSWILDRWENEMTSRSWGLYRVFHETERVKVKELVIEPNNSLSDQRHLKRSDHWYILEGECMILLEENGNKKEITLKEHETLVINKRTWHKAINEKTLPCSVLEVQYGDACVEDDIERRD